MAFRIEFTILKPVIWLIASGMLGAAAISVHYQQAQIDASHRLAMRLDLPEVVAIEDFNAIRHSNEMSEVQLAAQVRADEMHVVMRGSGAPLYLFPLYPEGADLAAKGARPHGFYLSGQKDGIDGLSAFGFKVVRATNGGVLIHVTGTRLDGQAALGGSDYDLEPADLGLRTGAFIVAEGLVERQAALARRDVTGVRDSLRLLALGVLAMAGVSQLHGRRQVFVGRHEQTTTLNARSAKSVRAFQPLATQEEIVRSDAAERARRRRSRLNFASTFTAESASPIKSPQ